MTKEKLVLIGNGMAGMRCIEYILQLDATKYDITIIGEEPYSNYNRIMLSSVLQGKTTLNDIIIHPFEWYEKNNITLYTNEKVTQIMPSEKIVKTTDKDFVYDRLILATGSHPFMLPIHGIDKKGVYTFRTIDDCNALLQKTKEIKTATVIGGGILGIEAARGLLDLGLEVNIVHLADRVMNHQLDNLAAEMLQHTLAKKGMQFFLNKKTKEIIGNDYVEGILFDDGTKILTDLVLMAVGVRPNIDLTKDTKLQTNRGIVVNDYMETSLPNIYAIGECAEHNNKVYGLVKPVYEQAKVLAHHLCNPRSLAYSGTLLTTQLKISDVEVFSIGQIETDLDTKIIATIDQTSHTYKKIVCKDDKIIGAILIGEISQSNKLIDAIKKQKFLSDKEKKDLLLPVNVQNSYAACLKNDEYICTCNNVTKGTIIDNVVEHQLRTVQEIKKCTKASSACGGCKPVVEDLLTYIHSDYFVKPIVTKNFCPCTTLSEEEIVRQIQDKQLTTIHQIRKALGFKQVDGCATCKKALSYYLDMIYPDQINTKTIFYINEKINASKQQNGKYTIIPKIYGNVMRTTNLQNILSTLQAFRISDVTIQHNKLILQNIEENDVLAICEKLHMPLIPYVTNMLLTVHIATNPFQCTCDSNEIITFATFIEKHLSTLPLPHIVDLRVHCCGTTFQATHKNDVHIVQQQDVFEMYVGKDTQLLSIANNQKDAQKFILSLFQYYRQTANYDENIHDWIIRMGIVHVREILFNTEMQNLLLASLISERNKRKWSTCLI